MLKSEQELVEEFTRLGYKDAEYLKMLEPILNRYEVDRNFKAFFLCLVLCIHEWHESEVKKIRQEKTINHLARPYGKTFALFDWFVNKGETQPAVFKTPEGDYWSPKKVEEFKTQAAIDLQSAFELGMNDGDGKDLGELISNYR